MFYAALLLAQAAPCTATDAGLPPPLAGWAAPGEAFVVGKAVTLDTADATGFADLPAGAKPGRVATIGFTVGTAGIYGIAMDQAGWIDVSPAGAGDAPLRSVKHGHGPECSSIRKIVRFELAPGAYRPAVAGLALPEVRVMLVAPE